jgi:hypothetical protein
VYFRKLLNLLSLLLSIYHIAQLRENQTRYALGIADKKNKSLLGKW